MNRFSGMLLTAALAVGCATAVQMAPSELTSASSASEQAAWTLREDATVQLDTGYSRTLRKGSRWQPVGRVAQGQVLRPLDGGVLTVEGSHQHEAYLVVSADRKVIGFFLPAERAFVALGKPVGLAVQ
jgi:hypothetical protein